MREQGDGFWFMLAVVACSTVAIALGMWGFVELVLWLVGV